METFGKIIFGLLLLIVTTVLSGFVFTILWGWFIVPTFGMQDLRVIEGIGIMFIIGFVKAKIEKDDDGDIFEKMLTSVVFSIFWCLMALGIGYIISQFM